MVGIFGDFISFVTISILYKQLIMRLQAHMYFSKRIKQKSEFFFGGEYCTLTMTLIGNARFIQNRN